METTIDGLLDKRVTLEQPARGYRVAVDTVLLAASVPAQAGDAVLDLGCGVGGAMFCLAARVPGVRLTGMEIDEDLAELGRVNIARNSFVADARIIIGDASVRHPAFAGVFAHVMMNPPYHDEARHDVSDHAQKRRANTEKDGDLAKWLTAAAYVLADSGCLTLIHRADREPEILGLLAGSFGAIEVCAVVPKRAAPPKRTLLRARKQPGSVTRSEFILHVSDGRYTEAAESILRHAAAMPF